MGRAATAVLSGEAYRRRDSADESDCSATRSSVELAPPFAVADSFSVFAHLNVEKTALYRAVLDAFVAALRPAEVAGLLRTSLAAKDAPSAKKPSSRPSPPISGEAKRGFREHGIPHFRAIHGDHNAVFAIDTLSRRISPCVLWP